MICLELLDEDYDEDYGWTVLTVPPGTNMCPLKEEERKKNNFYDLTEELLICNDYKLQFEG